MAKDYEDYRRRNERTQEAVPADATLTMQHAAARDIMRMKITASRSDELVRLVRQKIRYQRKAQTNYEIGQLNRQPKS